MESRTLHLLDYPKVLDLLTRHAVSGAGQRACQSILPLGDQAALSLASRLLRQAMCWFGESSYIFSGFPEIDGVMAYVTKPVTVLDKDALWAMTQVLELVRTGRDAVLGSNESRFPLLVESAHHVIWPEKVWSGLRRCMGPDGELKDESSPALFSVRQEIRNILQRCTRKVNDFFGDQDIAPFLQDEFLTISSDRYVLAVKSNFKGKIRGIVHDYSQTGETCYVEPLFLVELNNQFRELKQEEKQEEQNILAYLTDLVRQEFCAVGQGYAWLVTMDVLQAKTRFARQMQGITLDMEPGGTLELREARHPLLAAHPGTAVPIDILLEPGQKGLLISGGNAGGKTVSLKTLGLIAVMAQAALPVPVREGSSLPYWNQVVVSMGDEQSLEDSLSTFTAQISHFSRLWPKITGDTLVILDEFGMGTDPSQGAALAQAVVDALLDKGAWVGVATHFPALKVYGLVKEGVRAASVLFDPRTKKPLFRLAYDQVGASQALDVAREQGLDASILARAEEYLLLDGGDSKEIFERLNALAAEKESEIERLKRREAVLEKKWEQRRAKLDTEREEVILNVKKEAQDIVRQWRAGKQGRKQALEKLAKAREQLESGMVRSAPAPAFGWDDLRVGKRVVYAPWDKSGVIEERDERKQKIKLNVGGVSLWVNTLELLPERVISNASAGYVLNRQPASSSSMLRLDLRGMRADDAKAALESFLDTALLKGGTSLEIVHGKGTGVLRQIVHEVLDGFPGVESFSLGNADEGGDGMTRVILG
ncbi:MAG: Smr/MutS family protein [Desulfoplanes sp.]